MKKNYNFLVLLVLSLTFSNFSSAQCSIVDVTDEVCGDGAPVILYGDPIGGTFSGPGVTGNLFNPELAGVGTHTVEYSYFSGANRYYIRGQYVGEPWGSTSNTLAMNTAFGDEWELAYFETLDMATVFSEETSFIFLEGSNNGATELRAFLEANLPEIEAWVAAGGALLINSAPNEGTSYSFGFGGSTLVYAYYANTVTVVDTEHPIYVGPNLPTAASMTGSSYGHARITGSGFTNILVDGGNVILCEKPWGAGHVMMGGMTMSSFHNPDPHADNWRANIMVYMDNLLPSGVECIATHDITVLDEFGPPIVASSSKSQICLGESYILTASGADDFDWGGGIEDGDEITPEAVGTFTHLLTATSEYGCTATASVSVVVNPVPVVDAGLDIAQCEGEMVVLTGSGADEYEWSPAITNGVPFVVNPGETTYTVTGTSDAGCEDTDEVVVTGVEIHEISAVVTDEYSPYGASIDITVTGGSGSFAYSWSHGPTTQDVSGLMAGTYAVVVNDVGVEESVCPDADSTFFIRSYVGIEDLEYANLLIYPNPTDDHVMIQLDGDFQYEVYNIIGELIISGNGNGQKEISMADLNAGTYLFDIYQNDKKYSSKIVKN